MDKQKHYESKHGSTSSSDTIAAVVTPPGRGAVGIVRLSGPRTRDIAQIMLENEPEPRIATFGAFYSRQGVCLDQGLSLFFPKPNSYTGEDVLELQGHGGPVVMDRLLREAIASGARHAEPGEFSRRAFLNDKIDLTQAEAVADLIESASEEAAHAAIQTLQGKFSQSVHELTEMLTELRVYIEAALDFPDEEIDDVVAPEIKARVSELCKSFKDIETKASQGVQLQEGLKIAIVGRPNAGKSSLLNRLAAEEIAIVADVPGTTRDVLRQTIYLGGAPIQLIDTAGIRETDDMIEREGVRRAHAATSEADLILLVIDQTFDTDWRTQIEELNKPTQAKLVVVFNKSDLSESEQDDWSDTPTICDYESISLSAKTGEHFDQLHSCLRRHLGLVSDAKGVFSARRRHLDALIQAQHCLTRGFEQFITHQASELFAEELRQAQALLGIITGEVTADDLLGEIFSSFCIGK
ncbi:MAG: tRNA uridine-5-carboxymethylaminomethyl(34) synthesis GTPase MnmE [Gammaproteobacteria bacterium]|nr:tRNA uridine-5-carboxymethylaminomethyl(34) synthesis GTPase MnmE [Gammaproteobacteria bacterium]